MLSDQGSLLDEYTKYRFNPDQLQTFAKKNITVFLVRAISDPEEAITLPLCVTGLARL